MNIKNISGENNTASIGISFDIPNEREIIAIGSPDKLKAYFTLGIENPEIEIRTRKLGSLVDEMNELAQSEADDKMQILAECSNGLCGIISEGQGNKSAEEYINALAELYDSSNKGNMLLNFMIFFYSDELPIQSQNTEFRMARFCFINEKVGSTICGAVQHLRIRYAPAVS